MGWVLAGLALIALGIILFVDRAGYWDAGDVISQWWPTIIIAVGLAQLAGRPRPWLGSMIIVGIGAVLLIHQLGLVPGDIWDYVWPSLIIAVGVWMIAMYARRKRPFTTSAESLSILAVFGDARSATSADAFTDGSVTAVFGEAELDLRNAGLAPGGADVAATAIFGDATVVVPHGWHIQLSPLPILGDVKDKTRHDGPAPSDAPRLRVRGIAIFGDVEVEHES
jgi:predicted membrane protein